MQGRPYSTLVLVDRRGSKRGEALVDCDVHPLLLPYRWWLDTKGYARRSVPGGGNVQMHREILGLVPHDGKVVDHINRDRLDNRRDNLRVVDRAFNHRNVSSHRKSTSRYRAVYWDSGTQRWRARVRVNGRAIGLGSHRTELDAALAVERWRLAEGLVGWERDPALPPQPAMGR